jgi:hypothetical protein
MPLTTTPLLHARSMTLWADHHPAFIIPEFV